MSWGFPPTPSSLSLKAFGVEKNTPTLTLHTIPFPSHLVVRVRRIASRLSINTYVVVVMSFGSMARALSPVVVGAGLQPAFDSSPEDAARLAAVTSPCQGATSGRRINLYGPSGLQGSTTRRVARYCNHGF